MIFPNRYLFQRLSVLILIGSLTFLSACGAGARSDFDLNSGQPLAPLDSAEAAELAALFPTVDADAGAGWVYEVQEGDKLEVVFFSHPDQNRFVTVRPDGRITLPYLGDIVAARKEPVALAREIETAYEEVLVAPRVDVLVQDSGARFYVLGQVRTPGEYAFQRRLGVLQALARAGGYNNKARLSHVVLLRKDDSGQTWAGVFDMRDFMDAESRMGNIAIRPYDIVWVPKSGLGRWDDATGQAFRGVIQAQQVAIDGWSLVNFDDVFQRRF